MSGPRCSAFIKIINRPDIFFLLLLLLKWESPDLPSSSLSEETSRCPGQRAQVYAEPPPSRTCPVGTRDPGGDSLSWLLLMCKSSSSTHSPSIFWRKLISAAGICPLILIEFTKANMKGFMKRHLVADDCITFKTH